MKALECRPLDSSFFAPRGDTLVAWLGMAGVAINARGTIIFIDPLLTSVPRAPGVIDAETGHHMRHPWPVAAKDVPRADAVLVTHTDADHLGRVTLQTLGVRLRPLMAGPRPVMDWLEQMAVDSACLRETHEGDVLRVGAAEVTVTPALHDYANDYPFARADCCGYLVRTPDGSIWHPGDTRLFDDLLKVRGVDMLMFDVAAVDAHLGPAGSAAVARACGARALVAYHYGAFDMPVGSWGNCDPDTCLPHVADLPAKFLTPQPGEVLRLPLA